jgi:hypothetical protein
MDRTGRYCSSSSTDFHKLLVSLTKKKKSILNLKMLKFTCLLIVALMLQVSQAWDEGNNNEEEQLAAARQQSDEYFANAFGYTSSNPWDSAYYQPSAPGIKNRNSILRV